MGGKKGIRRNDALLLAGLLLAGVVSFIALGALKTDGAQVKVLVDGDVAASYPLLEDQEVDLRYHGYNLLKIEDGKASIIEADCPDKLCVKQRTISKEGETIICLPHRVVISISGGEKSDFDGVIQ